MEEEVIVNDKQELQETSQKITVETIITKLVKAPELKIDRVKFLNEVLTNEVSDVGGAIESSPIVAGVDEKTLRKVAKKLILKRTAKSAIDSFMINGSALELLANEISKDTIKFFGSLLRLSQELGYLYGMQDFWSDGVAGENAIKNQLLLYYGAMVGVKGTTALVNKITHKAQENAKTTISSSIITVVGGAVSSAVTFATMLPMAEKLLNTLEKSTFHYTDEELAKDIEIIDVIDENVAVEEKPKKESLFAKGKEKIGGLFKKKDKKQDDNYEQIKKLKELLDIGAITEEEFEQKKKQILGL